MSEARSDTLVEMKIASDPRLLNIVRCAIERLSQMLGFSQQEARMITLAVDEACANVICHTYEKRSDCEITIQCRRLPDGLEIVLQDGGPKVEEGLLKPRPLDEVKPGGLGLHFMYSIMDRVMYDSEYQDGNRLIMIKKFKPAPTREPSA